MSSKGKRTVVELGVDQVKLVQLVNHHGTMAVSKLDIVKARDGVSLAEALTEVVKEGGYHTSHVVGCLPRHMVNVRMFDLPSVDHAEIAGMVELQFGKQVPYTRDEVVADYRVVGSPRDGYTHVMLAVIQRGPLRECFTLMDAAGLNIETMTISSDGVAQWAAGRATVSAGQAEAVLDVDAGHSDLVVAVDGELAFTRSIQVGAEQLAEGGRLSKKLLSEAQQALEIFRGERPELDVVKLIVTGCARLPANLAADLGDALSVPVEQVKLSESLADDPSGVDVSDPSNGDVALTALVGVGRHPESVAFKLFPEATLRVRAMVTRAKGLTLLGVLLVSTLFSGSFYGLAKYSIRNAQAQAVHEEYERTRPAVQRVAEMQAVVNAVAARSDARFSAVGLLEAIHAAVPEGLYFDSVVIDMGLGEVKLKGAAATRLDMRDLIMSLKDSPLLRDVKDSGASSDRNNRFRFDIVAKFEGQD